MFATPSDIHARPGRRAVLTVLFAASLGSAGAAFAQPTLSLDFQGPSSIVFGGALDPGAVYLASPAPGPVPPPALLGGPAVLGIGPGSVGAAELDALSWGDDTPLRRTSAGDWGTFYRMIFSTDEFAAGDPALAAPPDLFSEGALGNREASADVQVTTFLLGTPAAPLSPAAFVGHSSLYDGDGFVPFGGPGLGFVEPNPPNVMALPDFGDTVDALDYRGIPLPPVTLYFSLDARFADPLEGVPANSGTAASNFVRPGDVLGSSGGGVFFVFAPAIQLGLGPFDDLDALILWENGNGVFDPSAVPFDWTTGGRDMLLFSVRRGSPIIGTPDAFFGIPIEEGDVLTTPPAGPGTPPGIFVAAEALGLATVRNGTDFAFPGFGDDLNAMSIR